MITIDRLKELVSYDPTTGVFTWLKPTAFKHKVGDIAGWTTDRGYIAIQLAGRSYLAHRLAWYYMTGTWPTKEIDHEDRNTSNNAYSNLREAEDFEQGQNKKKYSSNTSGVTGVCWDKRRSKWTAYIAVDNKRIHLGSFVEMQDAINARAKAKLQLHTFNPVVK